MELGLHRRETYNLIFSDHEEQSSAVRTFWSVYVLDRRWSFGTGMPFALQDADIDPNVPKPVSTHHSYASGRTMALTKLELNYPILDRYGGIQ